MKNNAIEEVSEWVAEYLVLKRKCKHWWINQYNNPDFPDELWGMCSFCNTTAPATFKNTDSNLRKLVFK
jgi:hypothetical protein